MNINDTKQGEMITLVHHEIKSKYNLKEIKINPIQSKCM